MPNVFEKLNWQSDRMLLDDLVFRLEPYRRDDWELGNQCFVFYKTKPLVDQYDAFWRTRPDFAPQNFVELGVHEGGSLAFWFEAFHPAKLIGIDIQRKETNPYLVDHIRRHRLEDRLKIYWATDQSDAAALRRIVAGEFSGPLDLVIDDASHYYELTKASFETLFPLLRPGGLYIVEDWAWGYWKNFRAPTHPFFHKKPLSGLVAELIAAVGSWGASAERPEPLIASVSVFQGFAAIERGGFQPDGSRPFVVDDYIAPGALVRDIADDTSFRKLLKVLALKVAAEPGFGWLNRFKGLGKRLLQK